MTNDANVSILLGTGTRSFGAPRRFFVDRMLGAYLHSLACGDLDGDGVVDLAVAKEGTGWGGGVRGSNVTILRGDGTGAFSPVVRFAPLSEPPASVAVGDLDGDGKPDLVWRNRTTGQNAVWLMNGTALKAQQWLPAMTDTRWRLVMAADFDGDGHPDLVWRNASTGENTVWFMNGVTLLRQAAIQAVSDVNWMIQ
jgi:hypothetical protein